MRTFSRYRRLLSGLYIREEKVERIFINRIAILFSAIENKFAFVYVDVSSTIDYQEESSRIENQAFEHFTRKRNGAINKKSQIAKRLDFSDLFLDPPRGVESARAPMSPSGDALSLGSYADPDRPRFPSILHSLHINSPF